MSGTRWTPGPWQTSGVRARRSIAGEGLIPVLSVGDVAGTEIVAFIPYSDRTLQDHIQAHADQRLISCAPEMYEALVLAREAIMRTAAAEGYTDVTADEWPLLARIDAALTRARGPS